MTIPSIVDVPLPAIHPRLGMWPAARFCAVAGVPIFPGLPSSKLPNVDQLGDGWSTTRIGTTDLEQVDL